MHYLAHYAFFLAKTFTLALIILSLVAAILALFSKGKDSQGTSKLKIKKLNEIYNETQEAIQSEVLSKSMLKDLKKSAKKRAKKEAKTEDQKPRIFVINFEGDIKASAVSSLSELITAILLSAQPKDEVLLRLESAGGMVNAYGLAASQLQRLKDAKIKLTVSIDKVAASGGYLMACVADQILAAPFAIIGSIGVIAQLPNFHRFLSKQSIDFEQITAGDYKRTLSLFGENTEKGREKLQEEVNDTHELFKSYIQRYRPDMDLNKVATGEHWFATRAMDLGLIDHLKTSDDYLLAARDHAKLYELQYKTKQPLAKRLGLAADAVVAKIFQGRVNTGSDYL